MMKSNKILLTIFLVVVMSGLLVSQAYSAKIMGKVTDKDGAALPGVYVYALNPKMVGSAYAISDKNGVYRLFSLRPGRFTIKFELKGFTTIIRKNISIKPGQALCLKIKMSVQDIGRTIIKMGEAPIIDVKSTTSEMTLSKEEIERLPRGRDFTSLVALMPSVNNERWLSGISVDGASGAENRFYVDGIDTTEVYYGTSALNVAYDFVEDVQVNTSGYQAEFGGTMGGVINVITRSGGNEFHGEIIGYYSGSALNGKERDILRNSPWGAAEYVNYQDKYGKDKYDRFDIGFNLGGYILKDKVWFFGAFLPVFRKQVRYVEWLRGDIAEGDYTQKYTYWNYIAKITAQPFKDLRVSATFLNNFYKWRGSLPSREGLYESTTPYADYGFDYPSWVASGSMDYVCGKNLLISLRAGFFHTNICNQQYVETSPQYRWQKEAPGYQWTTTDAWDGTADEIPAAYKRPVYYISHGNNDVYNKYIQDRASINFDLNYYLTAGGEHSIKAGVQWVRLEQNLDETWNYPRVFLGWNKEFTYGSKFQHIRGKYGFYGVRGNDKTGPYGTFANPDSVRWAIYLQDSWTIGYKLTINLGIRAEKEDIPSFSDLPEYQEAPIKFSFKEKIAPRIGFVYDVFGDSSLKLYASYGIYYDVMKLYMAEGVYGGFKWSSAYYTLDDYKWNEIGVNNNYPGTYITTINWRDPSFYFPIIDPDLKPMSQQEITFGAKKKLKENLSLSLRVVNKHLRYAIEDVGPMYCDLSYFICNPGYGWSLTWENGGEFPNDFPDTPKAKREYWAVNIGIEKKFSNNWMGGFSYTWSRLTGNYSGLASSDEYGRNEPNVERNFDIWFLAYDKKLNKIDGPLQTDRTHQIKAYGSYVFPFGLTLGITAYAMSGTPVSTEYRVWVGGYMPYGRGDLGRTPFLKWANLYLEYALKIGSNKMVFSVNVDNVFDANTAQRIWSMPCQYNIPVSDDDLLNNSWEFSDYYLEPDPKFMKKMDFFPPISARIGLKFVF